MMNFASAAAFDLLGNCASGSIYPFAKLSANDRSFRIPAVHCVTFTLGTGSFGLGKLACVSLGKPSCERRPKIPALGANYLDWQRLRRPPRRHRFERFFR